MAEHHGDRTDHTLERLIREVLVGQNRIERKVDHMSASLTAQLEAAMASLQTDLTGIATAIANLPVPSVGDTITQADVDTANALKTQADQILAGLTAAPTVSGA